MAARILLKPQYVLHVMNGIFGEACGGYPAHAMRKNPGR